MLKLSKIYVDLMNYYEGGWLFHGTHNPEPFKEDKDLFFSTSRSFSDDYGPYMFAVKVELGKVFDTTNPKDLQLLFDAGYQLVDEFDETNYYSSVEEYTSNEDFFPSDTWESIEGTKGVIPFIFSEGFDSILITEDRVENYLTSSRRVVEAQIIKGPDG